MTNIFIGNRAETNMHALASLPPFLAELVEEAIKMTICADTVRLAVDGDPETLASLGRSIATQEGYLIEAVVSALATTHPNRMALTGMRLPLFPAALDLVRNNKKTLYQGLSFGASTGSGTTYHPDLVTVDPGKRSALIVDVKRSINGYLGGNKLLELQQRMAASGLVLPDILWREHQRLAVEIVGTAIVDASKVSVDVSDGIWPLSRLDELLDVEHAGKQAIDCMEAFRTGVQSVWQKAMRLTIQTPLVASSATSNEALQSNCASPRRGRPRKQKVSAPVQSLVTVGLFQPGARTH